MGKKRPLQDKPTAATSKATTSKTSGSSNKKKAKKEGSLNDWISSLARKETADTSATDKAGRIEKRMAKKRRREDRKVAAGAVPLGEETGRRRDGDASEKPRATRNNKDTVKELARQVQETVAARMELAEERPTPYANVVVKIKGKNRKWDEENIQPRNKDYGGIGLARPSLFLPLNDPSFIPKLECEFAAHIPGFFGKQRTKAMKKQLNSQMLWRKMNDKKTQQTKVNGKKLSEMSPDDRVEAMIQAGMI